MLAHSPRKALAQMSKGEIVSSLVGFTLICGFISAACAIAALRDQSVLSLAWNATGIIVAATVLASYLPRAFHELRARKNPAALRQSAADASHLDQP
jgi:divalent metal cation (Fe/Co/Zn/Cd) transporter